MTLNDRQKFTYKHPEKFQQICQPIFDESPLTFCSVVRVFDDGKYTGFMSDPVWTELYLKKHYQPTASLWVDAKINLANIGYCIWSLHDFHDTNADTKTLLQDCNHFNYNNGINIIDHHQDYVDIATFASPKTEGVERFFLEKQDILRNYILYVKEMIFTHAQLSKEFNTHYKLPTEIKNINFTPVAERSGINIKKYYLGFPLKNDEYLTQREIDCLLPFILGVPKKLISKRLNISIRTIESHMEKIKLKCQITNLSLLRRMLMGNQYIISLLPSVLDNY